ncbi:MAG: hypothetical protein ACXVAO_08790 [Vulcanimicrobiaceae bacterium]
MRTLLIALALVGLFVSGAFAQALRPPDARIPVGERPTLPHPFPRPTPVALPSLAPAGRTPAPLMTPVTANARSFDDVAMQSRLGPAESLARFPRLPAKSIRNTLHPLAMGRRPMSATPTSIDYSTLSNCASTVGEIFNVGCQIQFRLAFCNPTNFNANCFGQYSITRTDTFQDYYIDANSGTAQTIGATYTPAGGTNDYGPYHNLTLNNAGTVVLATYDATKGTWVAVVYITVGSANGLQTYADSTRVQPQTNFTIPGGAGTTPVYITINAAQYSDVYVVYVENTSINAQCVGVVPGGGATTTLCDPNSVTGVKALSSGNLYMQWNVTSAMKPGTYSLVAYDQTQQKRIAQTQIALVGGGGGTETFSGIAGNPSPNPAPASTPGSRFAFNNTTDQSDSGVNVKATGLTGGDYVCFTISDPEGRVYQDYTAGNEAFTCTNAPGSGILNVPDGFLNYKSPVNFAPNTYTVAVYDYNKNAIVSSGAFQLLGYNAITQFTDPTGTSVLGSSIVLPKNSSAPGGLQFTNDGDSYYGTGNGDTLSGVYYSTGSNGISLTLPCAPCTSEVVTDSTGVSWNVNLTNTGGGSNGGTVLLITPVTAGQSLAMNATITLPNLTFISGPGSATCTTGCTAPTSILPTDGLTWSANNSSSATNLTYFTNGNGNTYAGTATFIHLGITPTGSPYSGGVRAGEEAHGYYPRMSQSLYSVNEPFPANGNTDVFSMTVTNNSSAGTGNIKGIAVVMPTPYSPGSYGTTYGVDASSPTTWVTDATCGVTNAYCIKPSGANAGIAPGQSETIYIDASALPPSSFGYTDVQISEYKPTAVPLTPDASQLQTVLVSSQSPSQMSIDATAVGVYSIDGSLMTPLFNPTSEGTSTNNPVQISMKNTSLGQDAFPDFVDAIVFELPNAIANPSSFANVTSNWLYLGAVSPGLGGASTTDYWFGLCAAQFVSADGPVTNPPPVKPALPACSAATEQNAIAPGNTFTVTSNMNVGSTPGTITGTMYAHGANGNGWSKGHTFTLNVTPVSATAGFINAGTYGSPPSVPANSTPQIGSDSNTTFGNSFVYEITNTSSGSNNINSATITIPYLDASAVPGQDLNNFIWKITAAPTLAGSGWTHCQVTSWTNPVSQTSNGQIVIGNDSSGTCTLTPNGKLDVLFPMQAPYKVNDSYAFPTVVNGTVGASETWVGDTYIQTILQAQLAISVWPTGAGPGGSIPAPSCSLTCTYAQATNTLNFGTVNNLQSNTGTDVVLVSVYTNAATPVGWGLYVSTNVNPANTGSPTNELLTSVDSVHSTTGVTGFNYVQTTFGVVPTSGSGVKLVDTGSGVSPRRSPFDVVNSFQVNINGGSTAGQTATVTYTFISN